MGFLVANDRKGCLVVRQRTIRMSDVCMVNAFEGAQSPQFRFNSWFFWCIFFWSPSFLPSLSFFLFFFFFFFLVFFLLPLFLLLYSLLFFLLPFSSPTSSLCFPSMLHPYINICTFLLCFILLLMP